MVDRRIVGFLARRGTNNERKQVMFESGEIVYTTDTKRVYIGDGETLGGIPVSNNNSVLSTFPTTSAVGDFVFRPDLLRTYVATTTGFTYIGPYPDNVSIDFFDNKLQVASAGISYNKLNPNIVSPTGGIVFTPNGLSINYDTNSLGITPQNQLYVRSDALLNAVSNTYITAADITLTDAILSTFAQILTANDSYLIMNINGTDQAIQLWDLPTDDYVTPLPPPPPAPVIGTPPFISIQPIASQTITTGNSVTISVVAGGSVPLSYQWYKNDILLVGKTSASLTINAVTTEDAGVYKCVVTNLLDSTTSNNAELVVQKEFDGTTTISNNACSVNMINVLNAAGWDGQESSLDGFKVTISGKIGCCNGDNSPTTPTFTWGNLNVNNFKVNIEVVGVAELVLGEGEIVPANITITDSTYLAQNNAVIKGTLSFAGGNSQIGSCPTPNPATTPISITLQPVNASARLNDNVTFTIDAVGSGVITYQWYKYTTTFSTIVGATQKTLTINNINISDITNYRCVVRSTTTSEVSSNTVNLIQLQPLNDTTDSVSYPNHILYTAKNFKIYTLIKKSANFSQEAIDVIKDSINKWSSILKDTVLPVVGQNPDLFDQRSEDKVEDNPLKFTNDGYVLVVDNDSLKNGDGSDNLTTLAFANADYVRWSPNEKHHLLPCNGYCVINTNTQDAMIDNKVGLEQKSMLYKIIIHELGHALGIGTTWFWRIDRTRLRRSFVVGAGDSSTNTNNGTFGNVFYTINRGNNARSATDVIDNSSLTNFTLSTRGDARYAFAYNPDTPVGNLSPAVTAYNEAFGLSLTAIPLENAAGTGTYGCHWAEGAERDALFGGGVDNYGSDARQYYGNAYPGAPAIQDEMMTGRTPIFDSEMPISKITLGALTDLGWTVDYSQADNFQPLLHAIKYSSDNTMFEVKKNNFGAYFPCHNSATTPDSTTFKLFLHLRKGLTYRFRNDTGETLSISDEGETNTVTSGVTNITDNGVNYLQFIIPSNFQYQRIVIKGTNTSTKPKAKVYWDIV